MNDIHQELILNPPQIWTLLYIHLENKTIYVTFLSLKEFVTKNCADLLHMLFLLSTKG